MLWLTHLPSKYTLAWGLTLTLLIMVVLKRKCRSQSAGENPLF